MDNIAEDKLVSDTKPRLTLKELRHVWLLM